MKLYLTVISVSIAIIASANIIAGYVWHYAIPATVLCAVLLFVLDATVAFIINKMPNRWFGVENRRFQVSERALDFYGRLNVRRWKEKVLELGWLGGFSKKEIKEPKNPEYIERFIIECNKGVVTHRLSYFIGLLTLFIFPPSIALPATVVNMLLNVLPTIVLRDNTPKLKSLLSHMRAMQEREKEYRR